MPCPTSTHRHSICSRQATRALEIKSNEAKENPRINYCVESLIGQWNELLGVQNFCSEKIDRLCDVSNSLSFAYICSSEEECKYLAACFRNFPHDLENSNSSSDGFVPVTRFRTQRIFTIVASSVEHTLQIVSNTDSNSTKKIFQFNENRNSTPHENEHPISSSELRGTMINLVAIPGTPESCLSEIHKSLLKELFENGNLGKVGDYHKRKGGTRRMMPKGYISISTKR